MRKYRTSVQTLLTMCLGVVGSLSAEECCYNWEPKCFDYGLNPPVTCPSSDACSIYGEIQYLYMKPKVDDFVYADTMTGLTSVDPENIVADPKDLRYDWDSGFRIALGYLFPCDQWGLSLAWSHLRTDRTKTDSATGNIGDGTPTTGSIIRPHFSPYFLGIGVDGVTSSAVKSTARFEWNQLDLDFARHYYTGPFMKMRPYVGLRSLFLKDHVDLEWTYTDSTGDIGLVTTNIHSDFKGVGLKAGSDISFDVFCGLSIYGSFGLSGVYGQQEAKWQSIPNAEVTSSYASYSIHHEYNAMRYMGDLALGLRYHTLFNCNKNAFYVFAGWEHHHYWNAHVVEYYQRSSSNIDVDSNYVSSQQQNDVSLFGLTVGIGIDF